MENEKVLVLQLRLTGRTALVLLSALFVCWAPGFLNSETLTLTTYYPAPYGGYASLLTTGRTLLARDSGLLGVGTGSPTAKLHVAGSFRLVNGTQGPNKVLTSDASGLATWQPAAGTELSNCDNPGTPEASGNKPCLAPLYRCPFAYSANGVSNGPWGDFNCTGQLQPYSVCVTIVYPQYQVYPCTWVGRTPIY